MERHDPRAPSRGLQRVDKRPSVILVQTARSRRLQSIVVGEQQGHRRVDRLTFSAGSWLYPIARMYRERQTPRDRFVADSPLEENGFEPSVPSVRRLFL
jgi:hypothetical protein